MRLFASLLSAALLCAGPAVASQPGLVEPALHVAPGGAAGPRVALTFDACMGRTDMRILSTLIEHRMPATVFVTGRWLKHNKEAFAQMQAHPDLFEIENHGAMHVPAVDRPAKVYGIAAAGSPAAVEAEVKGGAVAIRAAGGADPRWFRGSTARYSPSAITQPVPRRSASPRPATATWSSPTSTSPPTRRARAWPRGCWRSRPGAFPSSGWRRWRPRARTARRRPSTPPFEARRCRLRCGSVSQKT